MITQIDVLSDTAFELPILGITPKSSLLIQKVAGLDPPDMSLFIGDFSQDGGIYQGRRAGNRFPVFTINLNPNPALGESVASLRQALYKAFMDPQVEGDFLKILLHDDTGRQIYFVGYTEKFESELFAVETMCQISMQCPDPYLRDNIDTILTHPTGWVQVPFSYQGTAETGFVVRIYATAATTQITLENNGKLMQLVNPAGYAIGDLIMIDTIRGQRGISLTKASDLYIQPVEWNPPSGYNLNDLVFYGSNIWKCVVDLSSGTTDSMAPGNNNDFWQVFSTPIVSQLKPTSQWLELHASSNTMRVFEGVDRNSIVANIKYLKYTSAYWGI